MVVIPAFIFARPLLRNVAIPSAIALLLIVNGGALDIINS
jgi:hypothetical protein